ncbi:MAG TPA: ABC transporter permease [Acidobacteriota bacterium]|nr:ABC transporter permease [Acidobacteriota bacterium]
MNLLRRIAKRLWTRIRPGRLRWEVEEEMSFHLEQRTEEYRRSGLDTPAARRRAQERFGSLSGYRSRVLQVHHVSPAGGQGANLMESILQDIRFAVRTLLRRPLFTVLCLITLALGIGANSAIFSVIQAVLLAPLPHKNSESLAVLWQFDRHNQTSKEAISVPDLFDFRERSSSIAHLMAFRSRQFTLTGLEDPERVLVGEVTTGSLVETGFPPMRGREFEAREGEPNGPLAALLRRSFAQRRFGSMEDAVGRSVTLNGVDYQVVGVLPEDTVFPSDQVQIWIPLQVAPRSAPRGNHSILALARLAPGVELKQANEEIASIAAQLEEEFPDDNAGRGAFLSPLRQEVVGDYSLTLWVLMAAVGVVLLIACANVANLMLTRAAARGREVGIRRALGAGRLRLARQFLTESLVLAGAAALLGLGLAWVGIRLLLQLAPSGIPRLQHTTVDPWVLGFTLLISALTGLLFGLAPALQSTRRHAASALRQGGRSDAGSSSSPRLRRVLVVGEVALALMLVTSAGLLLRSFLQLQDVDPGFQAERLLKADIQLPAARYPQDRASFPNWTEVHQFYARLLEGLERLPEAESFAFGVNHPMAGGWTTRFQVDGRPAPPASEQTEATVRPVSPNYFRTAGIQIKRGRAFSEEDRSDGKPVMILNESMARRLFADEDPLGQRVVMWGMAREVVGIAADVRFNGLDRQGRIAMYLPLSQIPLAGGSILIRTSADPQQVASALKAIVHDIDPQLPVFEITLLEDLIWSSLAQPRFNALLLSIFAVTALLLAVVGIFGVLSQSVALRRREMGVRMALGARPGDLMRSVVGQGLGLTAAGVVLGIVGAWLAGRFISGMLFQVSALDPVTFVSVPLILMAAALLACFLPARRAARSDPLETLRCE